MFLRTANSADELIAKYARMLEDIYNNQRAGDYTFEGVLSMMLREVEQQIELIHPQPPLPDPPPAPYVHFDGTE